MLPRPKYPNKLAVKQKVIQSDKEMINIKHKTKLHSSWMRTARLLTVSQHALRTSQVCQGGCLPGGVCPPPHVDRMTDRCKNITLP